MGGLARMERKQLDKFNLCWAKLYEKVPEARAEAVKAAGEALMQELKSNIQEADLNSGAKGRVRSWQALILGSKGGYFVLKPTPKNVPVMSWYQLKNGGAKVRQNTDQGKPVTAKQVTRWLEKGHGTRPTGRMVESWVQSKKKSHLIQERQGKGYVEGRQFYSYTKGKAMDLALKAADKVLSVLADEVDF